MKIHRFIYPFSDKVTEIYIRDESLVKQMTRVLKFVVGEKITLTNGAGLDADCEITEINKREIIVAVNSISANDIAQKKVILYASVLKRENFELIAQKVTEVGVSAIVPVLTSRTVKTGLNENRIIKIIHEAVEQCGRSTIPELFPTMTFEEALNHSLEHNDKTVMFDMAGNAPYDSGNDIIGAFIGPEGGWSEEERELAKSKGAEFWSLGSNTLRGETAAIIASYVAAN
jgi:16S rRNA (uracil1498-N3)-methyltransferase